MRLLELTYEELVQHFAARQPEHRQIEMMRPDLDRAGLFPDARA